MDNGSGRIECRAHVCHGFEFPIFDRNMLRRILRRSTAGRHNGGDRLALPADPVDRRSVAARRARVVWEALEFPPHHFTPPTCFELHGAAL